MSAARLELHGAFATREAAKEKARELRQAGARPLVRLARLRTGRRYLVLTRLEDRPGRASWWL